MRFSPHGSARVVLASTTGDPIQRVTAELGTSRPMDGPWQHRFAEAAVDGLCLDPPTHAVVLSIDEKARPRRSIALSSDCR